MNDSYDVALDLMADVVQRPTFAPEEIERQRQQALSALKVAAEDPESVAGQVIDRLIYGFHPYGMPGDGTPESLAVADARRLRRLPQASTSCRTTR